MQKSTFLLALLMLCLTALCQTPKGIKYQGVARDTKGAVMANQQLTLKITLAGNNGQSWTTYYTETHSTTTTSLGLFTLVVGDGSGSGKFEDVPWSTEDIWMEVSIRENNGFATISNSKLLAVPYAFHALTANRLVTDGRSAGVPSNVWSTFGNSNTNPANDALGTTDNADLMIITTNIERARVLANGNVQIKRSLDVGANLKVDSTVSLNDKSGSTTNNGPFTVARNSPTLLSGTLTVDLHTDLNASLNVDGPTELNSNLNVNNQKPTKLTGTLQVDGISTLKDSLFVTGGKPSALSGRLRVDSSGTFKQTVVLDNAALDQDTATLVPNGALRVAGGGGFGGNLTIGGSAKIGKGLSLGNLKVTDTTASYNTTTGALIVAGGTGIGRELNVGGKTTISNSLDVNAGTGQVRITGGTSGNDQTAAAYPLVVNGTVQGIQVNLSGTNEASMTNNFVTFRDQSGKVRGRIEGQTVGDLESDPMYAWDIAQYSAKFAQSIVDVGFAAYNLIAETGDVKACVGFGAVVCPPSPLKITGASIKFAAMLTQMAYAEYSLLQYVLTKKNHVGVVYSSGAGDYAEWLQRQSPVEKLLPGQVVGVRGGTVSLNTQGAERVLIVSTNPIVLGNAPEEGREQLFEKIAFLGQVPVRVIGKVSVGDYILASNRNDGFAVARHREDMTFDDLSRFIGIAWMASDLMEEKPVKVAVGISNGEMKTMIEQLQKKLDNHSDEINDLRKQINSNNELLAKLVPGYKASSLPVDEKTTLPTRVAATNTPTGTTKSDPKVASSDIASNQPPVRLDMKALPKISQEMFSIMTSKLNNVEGDRLPAIDDQLIDKMLEWGLTFMDGPSVEAAQGSSPAKLMERLKADGSFKRSLYSKIKATFQQAVELDKLTKAAGK